MAAGVVVNVHNNDDDVPTEGSRTYAIIVCVFAALGGLFFGYDQGVTSGVLIMDSFINDYCVGWHNFTYKQCTASSSDLPAEWTDFTVWYNMAYNLGCLAGAFIGGIVADKFGRRWTIFTVSSNLDRIPIGSGLRPDDCVADDRIQDLKSSGWETLCYISSVGKMLKGAEVGHQEESEGVFTPQSGVIKGTEDAGGAILQRETSLDGGRPARGAWEWRAGEHTDMANTSSGEHTDMANTSAGEHTDMANTSAGEHTDMANTSAVAAEATHLGRVERTTCHYKGRKYTRSWLSQRKIVYRCSKFRMGCSAKLEYRISAMGYIGVGVHTCSDNTPVSSIIDKRDEMKAQADILAIEHVAWSARQVWEELRTQFYAADNSDVIRGLSESQVIRRVHHARHQHYSGNVHGSIEIPPLSLALGESVSFFQFHYTTVNREDATKPTRILGWAHPSLVSLLRYHGTTVFVDGTFRCVPQGYAQCVIFMVHDRASGVFVPVFYVLSTSRSGDAYWDMVHFVVQATDQQIEPAEIVCDFESALMSALQTQFPNALVLGCLFHMKQALRRAMKRYAIPECECTIAMTRGVLDVLTVIDHGQVEKGIKWVKREIKMRCKASGEEYSKEKWVEFWGYFDRTWLKEYTIDVWNVFGLDYELVARTNNPLERFNRELNSRFPTPHPSMAVFVTVIKTISAEYIRRVADVPRGRVRRVERELIQLPEPIDIPSDIDSEVDEAKMPTFDSSSGLH